MKFPLIKDIATTSVISVDIDDAIATAIECIVENNHRNLIVLDNGSFRIFSVIDLLKVQKSGIDLSLPLSSLNLTKMPTIKTTQNILEILGDLNDSVEFICVVNKDNSLYGVITNSDITSNIDPESLMENYRLSDFLKLNSEVKWANKTEITSKLLSIMVDESFDNIVIVENFKPIGILTTKDVINLVKYEKDFNAPVSQYMTTPIETIQKDSTIKKALEFINNKQYKRVVVVDNNGELAGIITQKELISLTYSKWVIIMQEHQEELNELNNLLKNKNIEYEKMASTDSLTGLYTRYTFSKLFINAYSAMAQRDNEMTLIMLDIDYFKKINDTYGHNNGDKVLIQISVSVLKILRNIDIICRWGGDKFVALLPTANIINATKIAQKIRKYIEKLEIDEVGKVSVSFGVAQVRIGDNVEKVIGRADEALFLAKDSGKNCVKTELDL